MSPSPSTSTAPATVEYRRPWLYDKQREAIFCNERYGLIEASTKAGKTVGCIAWLYEQAFSGKSGRNYWWVAPVYLQAEIAFRRLKRTLPHALHKFNDSKLTITLPNGTMLWFKSADKPDTLYGEDVYGAVCDEASRWKEDSWYAVRTTLTQTRGPIRLIGNVKGRKNFFYKLARRAEANEPDMHYARITAYDAAEAGVIAWDEIEDAKRQLPEHVFRELYLAEPADDGGNPFGIEAIARCIALRSEDRPSSWGWDLAKSQDWTVGIALDSNSSVCAFHRWQGPWEETIRRIREITGDAPALVDSTGVGDPVLEALQKGRLNYQGFKFSQTSKQQLMEGLAVAIQTGSVRYPEGPIVAELESFEYEYSRTGVRYSAPQGLHDDCVMALGLAVELASRDRLFRAEDIAAMITAAPPPDEDLFRG
jgi:hypothetical protein